MIGVEAEGPSNASILISNRLFWIKKVDNSISFHAEPLKFGPHNLANLQIKCQLDKEE